MKWPLRLAAALLGIVLIAAAFLPFFSSTPYQLQNREMIDAAPSRTYVLGTDSLGRDRFFRLLYGARISLFWAPAAAFLSVIIAALVGGVAGYLGGWWERAGMAVTDLFLSIPWLFLLITARALLPLNVSPMISVVITFALLGILGWAASSRVICAGTRSLLNSDFVLQARVSGCRPWRLIAIHLLPNLKPVLYAQFWISIPVFILTEANLSLLGLGVAEPFPSLGSLLRELENYSALKTKPWILAPLLLLIVVVSCFQLILSRENVPA
jgi:peptide/nickel transport system permease protein